MERRTSDNTGLAKVAVKCSADSLVVAKSFVLRINICGEKPAHRKSAKRQSVKILSTNHKTKRNNIQKILLQTPQKTKPV
jgi:hypothetical protein